MPDALLVPSVSLFVGGLGAAALLIWAFRRQPRSDADTDGDPPQPTASPAEPTKRRADSAQIRTSATLMAVGITTLLMVDDLTPTLTTEKTYWLRIHSRVGALGSTESSGWESLEYRRQPFGWNGSTFTCGETRPPNIVFALPANGSNPSRLEIVTACERDTSGYRDKDPLACGTVSDNGPVVSVQYRLQRTGGGANCWNGNWNRDCTYRSVSRAEDGIRWSIAGAKNNPYLNFIRYSCTPTIKATDDNGFVTEKAITYTVT